MSATKDDALYRSAFDLADVGMAVLDAAGVVLCANGAFSSMLGHTASDVLGKPYQDFVLQIDRAAWQASMDKIPQGMAGRCCAELRYRKSNAQVLWCETRLVRYVGDQGRYAFIVQVIDISERKGLIQVLQRWLDIFQHAGWGVAISSPDGAQLELINPAFAKMHGYQVDKLIGRSVFDLVCETHHAAMQQVLSGAQQLGHYMAEGVHRRQDGTIFPVLVDVSAVCDQEGVAKYHVLSMQDITQRKSLEQDLYARDRYQRALLDNFPFPVWLKDTDSQFLAINQIYADILGFASSDMAYGKTDWDGWPSDIAMKNRADDQDILRTRRNRLIEELVAIHDKNCWFETYKAPVLDADGSLLGTVGFAWDVTERKRAEEQLRMQEAAYRSLLDNSPDFIVSYDRDCRRLYVNPAAGRHADVPPANLLGKKPSEYPWGPSYQEGAAQLIESCIKSVFENGEDQDCELRWQRANGQHICLSTRLVAERNANQEIVSVLATGRDISALKQAEMQLLESRAQVRALAAHREIIREEERKSISREIHDELGQLLTALRLRVLTQRMQFGTTHCQINEQSEAMLELVDKAIQIVRDVAAALRPVVLDMGIVDALEWLSSEFTRHAAIPCRLKVSQRNIVLDEVCATVMFRIVQESLTNIARHANASCAGITLTCRPGGYLLEVRDNGRGFKVDLAKRRKSFGLVGMQERALMVGGEFTISSVPGKGTVMRLSISLQNANSRQT